jgi:TolA-binding protein
MKQPACARSWQAEAAEDGRLTGSDRASFERHVTSCATCTREVHALGELRRAAAQLPVQRITPLERRRQRGELLRRAHAPSIEAPRSFARPLLALALVVVAIAAWVVKGPPAFLSRRVPAPTYRLVTSDGAAWRPISENATLELLLERGHFDLAVDKLERGQRFLLDLPDGELEVQGTQFIVEVDGARTSSVRVREGRVALRLRSRGEILLRAGEGWSEGSASIGAPSSTVATNDRAAPSPPIAPSSPGDARDLPPSANARPAPSRAARGEGARGGRAERAPRGSGDETADRTEGSAAEPQATPAADFARAMAAFSAGDYGRAEQLFLAFESDHAGDARAEDATFLRAIARSRRGDLPGAQAIARDYLRRFPAGLRRREAERLAGE